MDNGVGPFLRSRRERLTPEDVGLQVDLRQRRVKGLRREELARLAGVSVDYYMRLEQGRATHVSDSVLSAVARALGLTATEHEHLVNLARPTDRGSGVVDDLEADRALSRLLDQMYAIPALMLSPSMTLLQSNRAARIVFGLSSAPGQNFARWVFTDGGVVDADRLGTLADEIVAHLRLQSGRFPQYSDVAGIVGELSLTSPVFQSLWSREDVRERSTATIVVSHPAVGALEFENLWLGLPMWPGRALVTYTCKAGSVTERRLARLIRTPQSACTAPATSSVSPEI